MKTSSQLHASILVALSLTMPLLSSCTDELVAATPPTEPVKNILQLDGCLDPVVLPAGFNANNARKSRTGAQYKWSTLEKDPFKIEGVLMEGIDSVTIQVSCRARYKNISRLKAPSCKTLKKSKNSKFNTCKEMRTENFYVQKGSATSKRYPGKIVFGLDFQNKASHVEILLFADLRNENKASLEFDRLTAEILK